MHDGALSLIEGWRGNVFGTGPSVSRARKKKPPTHFWAAAL
jgi:hypothetical protein